MKKIISIFISLAIMLVLVLSLSSCTLRGLHHVEMVIENYGSIFFELNADEAPITVTHFIDLAKAGDYDNTYFIRYQVGFVLQGGAGSKNTSTIKGEFESNGVKNDIAHKKGVISMARATDPNSASCQFFICTDTSYGVSVSLDGNYAAFGEITEGWDVFEAIQNDMYEYSKNAYMGFVDAEHYIKITTIKVID